MRFLVDSLFLTDKPNGISTHQVDSGKLGWIEYCENQIGHKLWVTHRLDKTTSGCLVFAKSQEAANQMRLLFESHQVKKKYLLITDRIGSSDTFEIKGLIEKRGKAFLFEPTDDTQKVNSLTYFKRVKRSPFFELWEAIPITGKPHQIRIHASHCGIPILGDLEYGGSAFVTLCLHASQIEIEGWLKHTSPAPIYFERLGLLRDPQLIDWLTQLDQRQRIYNFLNKPEIALRGFESKTKAFHYIFDVLGSYGWLHCYPKIPKNSHFKSRVDFISHLIQKPIQVCERHNRGQNSDVGSKHPNPYIPAQWKIQENSYHIELRSQQGAHYGLFLDQRLNRKWVQNNAKNKIVLNLFCYTGGFSVAAAVGQAKHITSVDISKAYIEWSQDNFRLNRLDPKLHQWVCFDATLFLKKIRSKPPSQKPNLPNRFDLIICDPPTFARTQWGVFKLEREYLNIVKMSFDILLPEGTLIFSCNLESFTQDFLLKKVTECLPAQAKIKLLPPDWDYALGSGFGTSKVLKISKP